MGHFQDRSKSVNTNATEKKRGKRSIAQIELFAVFTILALLAAIMLPNILGLTSDNPQRGAAAEFSTVQKAMNELMRKEKLSSVNATSVTNNMAAFPAGAAVTLYPHYLHTQTTRGAYACDACGAVYQISTGY
jgi:uncharacterized membrane protein YoaK (UPF0700 family)